MRVDRLVYLVSLLNSCVQPVAFASSLKEKTLRKRRFHTFEAIFDPCRASAFHEVPVPGEVPVQPEAPEDDAVDSTPMPAHYEESYNDEGDLPHCARKFHELSLILKILILL